MSKTKYEKYGNGPTPEDVRRTVDLREAQREFGLSVYAIYKAMKQKRISVIQPGGKGRYWYLADELRELAARLRAGNANEDWQHNLPGAA